MKRYGDLSKSPYKVTLESGITLYFSTQKRMDRFSETVIDYRIELHNLFRVRYGVPVVTELLSDMALYKQIEGIGFCVELNGEIIRCPDNIILDGGRMTKKG